MAGLAQVLGAVQLQGSVTLPMMRYAVSFDVTEPVHLPEYSGSTLRGAFGQALRRTACMTRQKDCKSCPLYRSCPYTDIFETPPPETHSLQKFSQIPNAYVIEPPNWGRRVYEPGEKLEYEFVLFGRARRHLALVVFAMIRAFKHDVGHGRAAFRTLHAVTSSGPVLLLESENDRIQAHENETTLVVPQGTTLELSVQTPLRLQNNGRPLRAGEITARTLLMSMVRRTALIHEFQCEESLSLDFAQLALEAEAVGMECALHWLDWTRYSSRQNRAMNLGGVVGSIRLTNLSHALSLFCACSTLTHVGKNATFGLGRTTLIGK